MLFTSREQRVFCLKWKKNRWRREKIIKMRKDDKELLLNWWYFFYSEKMFDVENDILDGQFRLFIEQTLTNYLIILSYSIK